ncbi:baseplate J/gp47 family protein [Tepidibacter mesophilus]|uniref:baseplate J/gp47 family protein n=1 Tax=Tepidibacter mesophilus TaxID=655607 RepID=UPI000C07DA02|nr:baseplate J/gp47 family protein [Tepidibacter mesophilus]
METSKIIQDRMLSKISDKYDKSEGEFHYDVTKANSIEFENVNKKINGVEKKLSIENLEGEELEQRVYERTGITKKQSTYSTTTVIINGTEGAIINVGDIVAADTVNFIAQEIKTIDNTEQLEVTVKCELPGSVGNVPVGAIKYFPITISGLNTVTNLNAVTDGYDAETDEQLLERYYERIKTPATSGNKWHYRNWAKEVVGVGDCKVFPLWNGDNTVKVVIIDSNKQPASAELVNEVQNHIDPKGIYIEGENKWTLWGTGEGEAPIGAFCTVTSATPKIINTSFVAIKDTSIEDSVRQQSVEDNISSYIKQLAFETDENNVPIPISYNKTGSIILDSKGIKDYSNLTMNNLTQNIILTNEEVPVMGGVTIV